MLQKNVVHVHRGMYLHAQDMPTWFIVYNPRPMTLFYNLCVVYAYEQSLYKHTHK